MTTIETMVYLFDELSDKAKESARNWWRESAIYDEWWEPVYEDASQIGLEITEFDIGRGSKIKTEFKELDEEILKRIKDNHGEGCDTYTVAMEFLAELTGIRMVGEDVPEWTSHREDAYNTFHAGLDRCYLKMLRAESEYVESYEYIDETIRANEYTFTETGERFG